MTRVRRAQTVQHLFAAIVLITAGIDHLHHNPPLAVAEIAAGALLIGAVIVEKVRHHHTSRIAWVEFAGAIMTLVEAIEKTRGKHHTLFYILAYTAPVILFLFAIFDAQLNARRYIKVSDDGIEVRLGLFFAKRYAWSEADRVNLRGVVDQEKARAWLAAHQLERGKRGTHDGDRDDPLVAQQRVPD